MGGEWINWNSENIVSKKFRFMLKQAHSNKGDDKF